MGTEGERLTTLRYRSIQILITRIPPQSLEIDLLIRGRGARVAGGRIEQDSEGEGSAVLGGVVLGPRFGRGARAIQDGTRGDEVLAVGGCGVLGLLVVDAQIRVFVGGVDLVAGRGLGPGVWGCRWQVRLDAGSLDLVALAGGGGRGGGLGRAGDLQVGADAEGGGDDGLVHDLGLFSVHGPEDVGGDDAIGPLVHMEDATVSGVGQTDFLLGRRQGKGTYSSGNKEPCAVKPFPLKDATQAGSIVWCATPSAI